MLDWTSVTGRLYLADNTVDPPRMVLDTNDAFLCVKPSDMRSGYQAVPERVASSSGVDGSQIVVDVERDYFLGVIDIPNAQVVRGMVRVTWDSDPEPGDGVWRQASGTHLDILDGVSSTAKPQSDTGGYTRVATMGGYTFLVNPLNHLIMRERIVMRCRDRGSPPTAFNRARRAATIDFRLLIGFFMRQNFTPRPGMRYLSWGYSNTSGATQTWNNVPCDYEYSGRRLYAVIGSSRASGAGVQASSVTIGGVAATIHGGLAGSSGANRLGLTIASALVPSGETATVSATFSEVVQSACVGLYAGGNVSSMTISGDEGMGTSVSVPLNVSASQLGLIAALSRGGQGAEITNVIEQRLSGLDSFFPRLTSGLVPAGAGSVTPAATWSYSAECLIAGIVFS